MLQQHAATAMGQYAAVWHFVTPTFDTLWLIITVSVEPNRWLANGSDLKRLCIPMRPPGAIRELDLAPFGHIEVHHADIFSFWEKDCSLLQCVLLAQLAVIWCFAILHCRQRTLKKNFNVCLWQTQLQLLAELWFCQWHPICCHTAPCSKCQSLTFAYICASSIWLCGFHLEFLASCFFSKVSCSTVGCIW